MYLLSICHLCASQHYICLAYLSCPTAYIPRLPSIRYQWYMSYVPYLPYIPNVTIPYIYHTNHTCQTYHAYQTLRTQDDYIPYSPYPPCHIYCHTCTTGGQSHTLTAPQGRGDSSCDSYPRNITLMQQFHCDLQALACKSQYNCVDHHGNQQHGCRHSTAICTPEFNFTA